MKTIRLTPPGRSAIATLLVEGDVMSVLQKCVRYNMKIVTFPQMFFGRFLLDTQAEEAVFCLKNQTHLEIHTHGGEAVVSAVEETLRKTFHATSLTWNEWLNSQRENRSISEQQFLALQKIPYAKTDRVAQILLDQYNGPWTPTDPQRLEENARLGARILEPFRIVLYGPVNSGKSSLLNTILGFSRVIAHSEPGTTRDTVGVESVVDGWPVVFFDTAGIRDTNEILERRGIEKTHEILRNADLVLELVDLAGETLAFQMERGRPACKMERGRLARIENALQVLNKCDLPQVQSLCANDEFVCVSAKTGSGIESLLEKISKTLVPAPPQPGEAVPLSN